MKVRVQVFHIFDGHDKCIDDGTVNLMLIDYHIESCIRQFGTTCKMVITVADDDQ